MESKRVNRWGRARGAPPAVIKKGKLSPPLDFETDVRIEPPANDKALKAREHKPDNTASLPVLRTDF